MLRAPWYKVVTWPSNRFTTPNVRFTIGAFNEAKAQLWNKLPAEERAEYEEEADRWALEGSPPP